MANGFDAVAKRGTREAGGISHDAKLGSRRIFAPQFKLQVLHSYRNDSDCRGNQRATARKYGIHRRQIQKWLQAEPALRGALNRRTSPPPPASPALPALPAAPRPASPPGPVDLSVRRAAEIRPVTPIAAWDLSYKPYYPKYGYEVEAPAAPPPPPPAPAQKSFRLFRPYLLEDNFEEVQTLTLASPSAFSRVAQPSPRPFCAFRDCMEAQAVASAS